MKVPSITIRQALATLGACIAVLLAASPANAVPDGFQPQLQGDTSDAVSRFVANHRAQEERAYKATRVGIPDSVAAYLNRVSANPTVIPYLSHGIGIADDSPAGTLRDRPDGYQPQLAAPEAVRSVDSGFDWETTGAVAGGVLAAMLLGLMSTIALRTRRGPRSA